MGAAGFAHGVLNTDNLSLLGLTLDLNVYGFLSAYDESWAPNHIDDSSRYAFGEQRAIGRWNLERLADALTGTRYVTDTEADAATWMEADEASWLGADVAAAALGAYDDSYEACYDARMRLRLGLTSRVKRIRVQRLVDGWHAYLRASGADHVAARGLAGAVAHRAATARRRPLPRRRSTARGRRRRDGWARRPTGRRPTSARWRWLRELWGALNDDAARRGAGRRARRRVAARVARAPRRRRALDVLREVTEAAAEGGATSLRAALAVLQRPLRPRRSSSARRRPPRGGVDHRVAGADATADELERVVRARLSAPTPASARGADARRAGQ